MAVSGTGGTGETGETGETSGTSEMRGEGLIPLRALFALGALLPQVTQLPLVTRKALERCAGLGDWRIGGLENFISRRDAEAQRDILGL